jgi:hypothetical protein
MLEKLKILRHDLGHKLGHKIARAENASHTGYLLMVAIAPHEYVALVAAASVALIAAHYLLGEG